VKITVALYALAIIIVAAYIHSNTPAAPPASKGGVMNWSEVKEDIKVPAKPKGVWTWAFDYVKGPALIAIEAKEGTWSYSGAKRCGPDGDLNTLVNTGNLILPGAPLGALIVKIGGSTAGVGDGLVRVAGSKALISIDEKTSGPIFLTINDELTGLADNSGELTVKLSIARVTPAATGDAKPASNLQ
jgi:hypothetical protein